MINIGNYPVELGFFVLVIPNIGFIDQASSWYSNKVDPIPILNHSAHFFHGDLVMKYFCSHPRSTADSRRAVLSFEKNVLLHW